MTKWLIQGIRSQRKVWRVILELSVAENLNQTWVYQEFSFMRKLEENWPPIYDPDFFLCFPMFSSSILLTLNLEFSFVGKFEENNPFMFIRGMRIQYMIFEFSHAALSVTASRLCYNGYSLLRSISIWHFQSEIVCERRRRGKRVSGERKCWRRGKGRGEKREEKNRSPTRSSLRFGARRRSRSGNAIWRWLRRRLQRLLRQIRRLESSICLL